MTERSLRVLEFHKIRAQLAQYCQSDMGAALCDSLAPTNHIEDVRRMQQETREAHDLLTYLGGTPMVAFSDVRAGAWYADAVRWAVGAGVTNGVGEGRFAPDETCTRAQIVTFLWRSYNG